MSMTKGFDFVYMVNIWPAHLFFLMLLPLSFSYTYCNRSSFMLVAFLLQVYCTCIWLDRVHLVAVLQIRSFLQHKGSYCDLKCFTSHQCASEPLGYWLCHRNLKWSRMNNCVSDDRNALNFKTIWFLCPLIDLSKRSVDSDLLWLPLEQRCCTFSCLPRLIANHEVQ